MTLLCHSPTLAEPQAQPVRIQDMAGDWHVFGAQWFQDNAEQVTLAGVFSYSNRDMLGHSNYGWALAMDYDKAKAEAKLQAEVDAMVDELVRLDMDRQERILKRLADDRTYIGPQWELGT